MYNTAMGLPHLPPRECRTPSRTGFIFWWSNQRIMPLITALCFRVRSFLGFQSETCLDIFRRRKNETDRTDQVRRADILKILTAISVLLVSFNSADRIWTNADIGKSKHGDCLIGTSIRCVRTMRCRLTWLGVVVGLLSTPKSMTPTICLHSLEFCLYPL